MPICIQQNIFGLVSRRSLAYRVQRNPRHHSSGGAPGGRALGGQGHRADLQQGQAVRELPGHRRDRPVRPHCHDSVGEGRGANSSQPQQGHRHPLQPLV